MEGEGRRNRRELCSYCSAVPGDLSIICCDLIVFVGLVVCEDLGQRIKVAPLLRRRKRQPDARTYPDIEMQGPGMLKVGSSKLRYSRPIVQVFKRSQEVMNKTMSRRS